MLTMMNIGMRFKNIKGITSADDISLDKPIVLYGPNGAGKTSIIEGFKILTDLLGISREIDYRELISIIKRGEKRASITYTASGKSSIILEWEIKYNELVENSLIIDGYKVFTSVKKYQEDAINEITEYPLSNDKEYREIRGMFTSIYNLYGILEKIEREYEREATLFSKLLEKSYNSFLKVNSSYRQIFNKDIRPYIPPIIWVSPTDIRLWISREDIVLQELNEENIKKMIKNLHDFLSYLGPDEEQKLIEDIDSYFNEYLTEITEIDIRYSLTYDKFCIQDKDNRYFFSYDRLSRGYRSASMLALSLALVKVLTEFYQELFKDLTKIHSPVLILENVDTTLHIDWQAYLVDILSSQFKDNIIFLETHSGLITYKAIKNEINAYYVVDGETKQITERNLSDIELFKRERETLLGVI